jgi:hypothetical protein
MPHFFIRQSASFLGTIPSHCHDELLLALQDTISMQLDCPMVRVTFSTDISVDHTLVDYDITINVIADAKMWGKFWEAKAQIKRSVRNAIVRKLTGALDENRVLVKTITTVPAGRSYR